MDHDYDYWFNMKIRFFSLNCGGLRNQLKRRTIFSFLKKQKYDVICLQEAQIIDRDYEQWQREWGGQMFFYSREK